MNVQTVEINTSNGYKLRVVEDYLKKLYSNDAIIFANYNFKIKEDIHSEAGVLKLIEATHLYDTLYLNSIPRTIHTMRGKRRSIGDLYMLALSYDKNAKLGHIAKTLASLISKNVIASYNCGQIKKRVFHFPSDRLLHSTVDSITSDGDYPDEYGWYWPATKGNKYLATGGEIELLKL